VHILPEAMLRLVLLALATSWFSEASEICSVGSGACQEDEVERLEDQQLTDLEVSLLQVMPSRLLEGRSSQPKDNATLKQEFAWSQVTKAVNIDNIKEMIDTGDVKESLIRELRQLEKECPDAEEIKDEMGDLWPDVKNAVQADAIKDKMEVQLKSIEADKEKVKKDTEASAARLKGLEKDYEAATQNFTKDQMKRLFVIVQIRQQMSDVKQAMETEHLGALDMQNSQDKYKAAESDWMELTKDMTDAQVAQVFKAVEIKKTLDAVEHTLTKDYQEAQLHDLTLVAQSTYDKLKEEYAHFTADFNPASVKKECLQIWKRALQDMTGMQEREKAYLREKR